MSEMAKCTARLSGRALRLPEGRIAQVGVRCFVLVDMPTRYFLGNVARSNEI